MLPNNRSHYGRLMQTFAPSRGAEVAGGGRSGTREPRSQQERSKLSNILFLSLVSPFPTYRSRGRESEDTNNEASFNSFNSTELHHRSFRSFRLLPSLSLFSSFSDDVELSREQSRTYPLNEGVVDLFMANWKRKLRGLQYRRVPHYFCPTVDPKWHSFSSYRFISAIISGCLIINYYYYYVKVFFLSNQPIYVIST